jgi:hypothetical protein
VTLLSCTVVLPRIAAFHDRELPVAEMIAMEAHVHECFRCRHALRELRSVGDALRAAAAPAPADDWTGLQPGVISRMRAEAHESFGARAHRMFEDMHLVWIAVASTVATFLCGGIVLSMLQFASPERGDSLAAVIADLGAPLGSDRNPARLDGFLSVPTTRADGDIIQASLSITSSADEVVVPLSVTITREGRVLDVSVLNNDHSDVSSLLDALSRARLQPAQSGGGPVAVSLVWLLAHTTVKGKISS